MVEILEPMCTDLNFLHPRLDIRLKFLLSSLRCKKGLSILQVLYCVSFRGKLFEKYSFHPHCFSHSQ